MIEKKDLSVDIESSRKKREVDAIVSINAPIVIW
jgi:hypothetical protein